MEKENKLFENQIDEKVELKKLKEIAEKRKKKESERNKKELKEIEEKIKNNDFNECQENEHDKMTLENRKMILENEYAILSLLETITGFAEQVYENDKTNYSVLMEISEEVYKDDKMDKRKKEKMLKLLTKLKPKKLTVNTGLIKAEWYD